jgi:hypothetical protein
MKKLIAIAVMSLATWGCKQGQGERCQVDTDCADGLTCSQAEPKTCGGNNSDEFDAEPAVDAKLDAPVDAAIDAPIDAPTDATDAGP